MSDIGPAAGATVLVCITCRARNDSLDAPRAGATLAEATALAAANSAEVSVQRIRCLGNCNRGLSAAIRCENSWTYVFGGLDPALLVFGDELLGLFGEHAHGYSLL